MTPYDHLRLLLHYERTLTLRAIIRDTIRPGMTVLDAGCGAGILGLWAVQAGADRVVGVDIDDLSLARALAAENGAASRMRFVQADLGTLDLPGEQRPFDAILAMVYLNDPRRDDAQADLVFRLKDRFLAPGGVVVPDRVRYYARASEWPQQDHPTRQARLRADVADLEHRYGVSLRGLGDAVAEHPWKPLFPERRADGRLDLSHARLLSDPALVSEIRYAEARRANGHDLAIRTAAPGVFNTIIWTQELWFADRLIFSNESVSWVANPQPARVGATFAVRLAGSWHDRNVATLDEAC